MLGIVLGATVACGVAGAPGRSSRPACRKVLFADRFTRGPGPGHLITNEYALNNPRDPHAVISPSWEMTSGSLFSLHGTGWTGHPDTVAPNAGSTNGTDSAVFRLRTRRASFTDVQLDLDLRVNAWVIGAGRETQEPEVVIWTHYSSERHLYWASVLRRTGQIDIEKKVPARRCTARDANCYNGGDYYVLPPYTRQGWPVERGRWYHVTVTARTDRAGAVTIASYRDGALMTRVVDRGAGKVVQGAGDGRLRRDPAAPISSAGRVGIRGDNTDFSLANFRVTTAC